MKTLEFGKFEHCIVFVCGSATIRDDEWKIYLEYVAKNLRRDGPNRSLVVAPGSTLSSTQRKELALVIEPFARNLKSAVITESALVRGIITALEWFHRDVFRIFGPRELDRALDFLDLNAAQAKRVKALAEELERKLAGAAVA